MSRPGPRSGLLSRRLYRALLRLFPRLFRHRHGAEMEASFLEILDAAHHRQGLPGLLGAWSRGAWDLVRHGPVERRRERRRARLAASQVRNMHRYQEEISMATITQDLRYAVRTLTQGPLFTLTVLVTLALGIGANTAIFSLIDATLLRPLRGVPEPDRVFTVTNRERPRLSYPDFADLRERTADVFSDVALQFGTELHLGYGGSTDRLHGELVSGSYFPMLGVEAALGRTFGPGDEGEQVAVLSHGLWQRRFGSEPGVVGETVVLNSRGYMVIGVAPEGFRGTLLESAPQLWVGVAHFGQFLPAMGSKVFEQRFWFVFHPLARLAPGVGPETARARLEVVAAELNEAFPADRYHRELDLVPARSATFEASARPQVRRYTTMLAAAVGLVLLIACLNVASLLAVRASLRRRELAVRLALGSGRGRLVRQLLVESLLLSGVGAAAGFLLARWSFDFLARLDLPGSIRPDLALDARVLGFGIVLSVVTGIGFGLVPALRASRPDLIPALKGDEVTGGRRIGFRGILVVTQMTLSLVLLIGAGLVLRTLANLRAVDPGFESESLLTAAIDPDLQGYDDERGWAFYEELLDRVDALPGVRSVSLTSELPMSGDGSSMGLFVESDGSGPHNGVRQSIVGVGFFRTMGIPLTEGRDFTRGDRQGAARTIVVNEATARRFWPGESAVGRRLGVSGPDGPFYEVVGVVRDHRHAGLRERPAPHLYWAHLQLYGMMSGSAKTLLVRTGVDPLTLLPALRQEVRSLDPNLALYDVTTLAAHLGETLRQERQTSLLLGSFAGLALLLAAVGLYGVLAWSVARRRREIGIRMALGARPLDAQWGVVSSGMGLATAGVVLGLGSAVFAERLLAGLLFEVRPVDPWTYGVTAGVLLAVAAAASYLPARRAASVEPMATLRYE